MNLGINVSDLEYDLMRDYAVRAEELGLDSVWVGETWGWEAFTLLGELAQLTDEITLGTGIVPVYTRSPSLLGQAAATVAEATGDRFVLGLGTSGPAVIENWHGDDFERPIGYTAETIDVIEQVLSGETVSHDGDSFQLDGFRFRATRESGDVPVFVGALGESNVRMSGAIADGWMPIFVPRSRISELYEEFAASASERGRDPDSLSVAPNTVAAISEDGDVARQAVRRHIAFYVGAMGDFYHRTLSEAGFEQNADAIREAWHENGPEDAAETISDRVIDETAVAGTPRQAHEQLDSFAATPADEIHLFFPRSADAALMESTIDHLATY
ncbi:LLM class flavin-dependent oxidoreductase [Natrinema halophilum]|uniref:LLM class flavin-dependent oxidoreductase n=1 Tax=Natrinema halophilum TaxID=1699371 RepID=A0A7D5GIW4_9EURY|nr:LLM class flavin-dependent oxidoreductase [Natrinema halophilum]QLG50208.1 LLM class flavin-dependent oxidoreductase [Natrinema halophilum]